MSYRPADLKLGDAFCALATIVYLWYKVGGSWWVFGLIFLVGTFLNIIYDRSTRYESTSRRSSSHN